MSASAINVRLDPRRLEQLKAIGSKLSLTSAGVIAQFIRTKIADGTIPADIPGVVVASVKGGVAIALTEGKRHVLSKQAASSLVMTIRSVVLNRGAPTVNLDYGYAVLKQGTGYKIAAPFPGAEVAFPGDLALDLADLIETAAK